MTTSGSRDVREWVHALRPRSMRLLKALAADPEARAVVQNMWYDDAVHVVDLVDWAVTHWIDHHKIEFLLTQAGADPSNNALITAFEQGNWACASLLYKHGARFTSFYQLGRYIEHGIPVEQRERVFYDHIRLVKGRISGEHNECLPTVQREVWRRESEAHRSTIAILSLKRKYRDRRFKDVWPLIARQVWYPRHQRVDARWVGEVPSYRLWYVLGFFFIGSLLYFISQERVRGEFWTLLAPVRLLVRFLLTPLLGPLFAWWDFVDVILPTIYDKGK